MYPYSVLMVDDDPAYLQRIYQEIEPHISSRFEVKILNDVEAISEIEHEAYDVYILDMEMPIMEGSTLAKKIKQENTEALIIFFTSHDDYALMCYELQPFRFVSKHDVQKLIKAFQDVRSELEKRYEKIEVCDEFGIECEIFLKDIECLYYQNYKVMLATKQRVYELRMTLHKFLEKYEQYPFVYISKQYVVSLQHIQSIDYDRNIVYLRSRSAKISRRRKVEFYRQYARGY